MYYIVCCVCVLCVYSCNRHILFVFVCVCVCVYVCVYVLPQPPSYLLAALLAPLILRVHTCTLNPKP
jgi:hypothetical protein